MVIPMVAAAAMLVWRLIRADGLPRLFLALSGGWAACAVLIFLAGHAGILRRDVFAVVGAGSCAYVLMVAVRERTSIRSRLALAVQSCPPCFALVLVATAFATLTLFRTPLSGDEVEYKWSTPREWALAGQFREVSARLSNGWNLAEYLSVPAALWDEVQSARLNSLALALTLALGAAALAEQLGASVRARWLVGAATLTMPSVLLWTVVLGNDLAAAMFLLAATVAMLSIGPSSFAISLFSGAAVWTKFIALAAAAPIIATALLLNDDRTGLCVPNRHQLRRWVLRVAGPLLALCTLGFIHTYYLTGRAWAPMVRTIYPSDHPFMATGAAAGRIPSVTDIALVPIVPVLVGVIGQREPYGGRVGLVLLVGLPALIIGWRRYSRDLRHRVTVPLLIATVSYLTLAPVFIKTRFLLFSYVIWLVVSVAVLTDTSRGPKFGIVTPERSFAALLALAWVSAIADPIRVLIRLSV